jgi:Skp family chaperone for outer membrane proteins
MKRSLALVFILASGMFLNAQAPAPAAAAATPVTAKVAVIAFQAAVAQSNEFQRNYADLEKKFEPQRQQLKAKSDEIDSLTKQLQAQTATLSEGERASRANVIDTKKKQLQRDAEDAQNDFQQQMQDMFKGVASKFYDVLASYAKEQGYTLVLDASQQESPILYAVDSVNITKPVLEAYNVKSGVPAPRHSPQPWRRGRPPPPPAPLAHSEPPPTSRTAPGPRKPRPGGAFAFAPRSETSHASLCERNLQV